jgi:hypothetical protein
MFLMLAPLPRWAAARVILLDGALELSGSVRQYTLIRTGSPGRERDLRRSRIGMSLSGLSADAVYRAADNGDAGITLFGSVRWWYDTAVALDSRIKRAIPHDARREYIRPRGDAFLHELYLDIASGPWQIVAGKQILVWGETDIMRTADVINPLDLRYAIPGIEPWKEIKQGLWMLRFLRRTYLPGDLLFEGVFIPGDFRRAILPPEGSHWGPRPAETPLPSGMIFGYGHWLLEKMRRDAPGWSLRHNYEWGLRVRGYTRGVDWTLLYFNTLSDTATMDPARSLPFAAAYARAALWSHLAGAVRNPVLPGYRVFRYKRYQVFGGTAQTHVARLRGSIWRLEWFYERGQRFNRTPGGYYGAPAVDEVRRDTAGIGLNCADKLRLPWITPVLCADKQLEVSLTLFHEKIFNYDRTLAVDPSRAHRRGADSATALIWTIIQPLRHQIWTLVFAGSYTADGMYFLMPMTSYAPGSLWRLETGAALFGDRSRRALHPYRNRDTLVVRIHYEW